MTRTMTRWIASPIALALGAMLIVAAPASAQDDKNKDNPDRKERQAERQSDRDQARQARQENRNRPRQLQAFDLEHRTPQEIQQLLSLRTQSAVPQPGQPVAGQTANPQRRTAFRPQLDAQERMAFAVDNENNVLFVRGSRQQIKEVEDLVKALDVSADKLEKQTIGETHLIPIHKENVNQVRTTLSQLQLPHQLITVEDAALVVISHDGSDEQKAHAEQVEQVISKLEASKGLGAASDKNKSDKEKSDKDTSDSDSSDDEAGSDESRSSDDSSDN